jgi:hypothetical protein
LNNHPKACRNWNPKWNPVHGHFFFVLALADMLAILTRPELNIMLIARQKSQATHVAGVRTRNSLGRFVKRGEKGILILAPCSDDWLQEN